MKANDIKEKRVNIDYAARGYKEQGLKERREIMENKLELINMKLNESISKNIGSFVITSFVSDSYCKREHLENQLQKLHQKTLNGGGRPPKEVLDQLKQESLPYVQMDTFLKKPPETTDLIGNIQLIQSRDEIPVHKNLNLQLTRTLNKHSLFTQTRDEIVKINLPLKEHMHLRTQTKRVSNKNKL